MLMLVACVLEGSETHETAWVKVRSSRITDDLQGSSKQIIRCQFLGNLGPLAEAEHAAKLSEE